MNKQRLILLSISSGILLAAAWPHYGITALIFFAWIPLLFVEDYTSRHKADFSGAFLFTCSYITFVTWNILTTWWLVYASIGGAAMAILANSLLMAMVFQLYHVVKNAFLKLFPAKKYIAFLFLIPLWITFEFLHLDWDLTYPWLNLGNVFSKTHTWIQWYEYTGVFGGSLWVLFTNVTAYYIFFYSEAEGQKKYIRKISPVILLIITPVVISILIYSNSLDKGDAKNVVVVQPNIDPYNVKFNVPSHVQMQEMLALAAQKVTANTNYLVFPETALPESIWENEIENDESVQLLKKFREQFPQLIIITGASTVKAFDANEKLSATARQYGNSDLFYDAYNTALQFDSTKNILVYHKSKLVPGVEKMPFPVIFKYLEHFALDMGGTAGSLGIQNERTAFASCNDNTKVAPVICYESIYGEYVSDYINNGANAIFIITNDGWWDDTPGYKQHLLYGRLRAIETRKSIARSANTGTSCFINQRGDIQQPTQWWEPAVIQSELKINADKTFYTRNGDYIARLMLVLSGCLIVFSFVIRILKKL